MRRLAVGEQHDDQLDPAVGQVGQARPEAERLVVRVRREEHETPTVRVPGKARGLGRPAWPHTRGQPEGLSECRRGRYRHLIPSGIEEPVRLPHCPVHSGSAGDNRHAAHTRLDHGRTATAGLPPAG